MIWNDAEVRAALGMGAGRPDVIFSSIATDSRGIDAGALFVALKGERFDAHGFINEVVAKGAQGAVVDHAIEGLRDDFVLYVVPDTLIALGKLGTHRRRRRKRGCTAGAGERASGTGRARLTRAQSTR